MYGVLKGVILEIKRRKEWEKRSKQNRIIDIAEELFNEYGYEGTTLDIIAKHAGYSKRNLYQYFVDKNDIFNAVTLKALQNLNEQLTVIINMDINGLQKTIEISKTIFTFFEKHRNSFDNIVFFDITYKNNMATGNNLSGSFGIEAEKIHQKNMKLILHALELGIEDGTIKSPFTPKQLQLIIWGQNLGILHSISRCYTNLEKIYQTTADEVFGNYLKMLSCCLQTE